jgi:hypothetical protein
LKENTHIDYIILIKILDLSAVVSKLLRNVHGERG